MYKKCIIILLTVFITISFWGCETIISNTDSHSSINWENGELIVPANDANLSEETKEQYQTSAKKLAIRYIFNNQPEKPDIPEPLVDLFYNGLIHIVNSSDPRAKLVTRKLNIQASQPASPHEIMVVADTVDASGWLDSWRNGNTMTGKAQLDELIDQFEYELKIFRELSSMDMAIAILRTEKLLNGYATGNLFKKIEGINSAVPEPVLYAGFRKDIEAEIFEEYLLYNFIGGNAKFRVFSNGKVEFADTSG